MWLPLFLCVIHAGLVQADTCTSVIPDLNTAKKLIVIINEGWPQSIGQCQLFEKDDSNHWKEASIFKGKTVEVSLGRKGMKWGKGLHPLKEERWLRQEGDMTSPAGVFKLGQAFGTRQRWLTLQQKQNFHLIKPNSYCVADNSAPEHNKILYRTDTATWNTALSERLSDYIEGGKKVSKLRYDTAPYELGLEIEHNKGQIRQSDSGVGYGSCIFLHIAKKDFSYTAGCSGLTESHLKQIINWRDQTTLLVQLPRTVYEDLQQSWCLPNLKPPKK